MQDQRTTEQALTHHVALVLDNDYDAYITRRAIVQGFMRSDDAQYPHLLGDQLKDWAESLVEPTLGENPTGEAGPMLAREVLTTAMAFVDWHKLAEDYIEEEREQS